MNKLKMYVLQILIAGFFIFKAGFVFPANMQNDTFSTTQVAVGTYIFHDNIEQPMLLTNNQNNLWSFIKTIQNVENGGYLYTIQCTNKTCISTGAIEAERYYWPTNHRRPLFMISSDNAQTWSTVKNISGLPSMTDGIAPYISCADTICSAVGWYQSNGHSFPLLLVSNDSGQSWSYMQNIAHLPSMQNGDLSTITCTENFCISGGAFNIQKNDQDKQLLFLRSQDRGQSWSSAQNISGLPKMMTANLKTIKCNNNYCVAAGNYSTNYEDAHALLVVSEDKGRSWTFVKEIPDLSNLKSLFIEDLIYTNGSFIAVGGYSKNDGFLESLIVVSNDKGHSWSLVKDISGSQSKKSGWLNSISCTDSTCVAGGNGFYESGLNFGLTLLVSKDNGKSWGLIPYVAGITYTPDINVVQCSGNNCVAMGNFADNIDYSHPALLTSNDKGQSWSVVKNVLNFPKNIYKVNFSSATNLE